MLTAKHKNVSVKFNADTGAAIPVVVETFAEGEIKVEFEKCSPRGDIGCCVMFGRERVAVNVAEMLDVVATAIKRECKHEAIIDRADEVEAVAAKARTDGKKPEEIQSAVNAKREQDVARSAEYQASEDSRSRAAMADFMTGLGNWLIAQADNLKN